MADNPNWYVIHKEHDSTQVSNFNPQNLSITLNKGEQGPHEVTYEASRGQDGVFNGFCRPYVTDFELWRGNVPIMSGMHTQLGIASNQESVQISGKSYLHYLDRRIWPYSDTDPNLWRLGLGLSDAPADIPTEGFAYEQLNVEVMVLIKDMLDVILLDDNCLPFTYVIPAIGHAIEYFTIPLRDSETILSKIQAFTQEDPGEFDFWMDFQKVLRVAAPRRYSLAVADDPTLAEHTFDMSHPESGLVDINFTNTGPISTWVMGLGQGLSITVPSTQEYLAASEQFRRLDRVEDFGSVTGHTRVSRLTNKALLFGLNPVHEITIEVATEKINNFWTRFEPGKAIWVKADLDGWVIDSAQEIVTMECSPTLGGDETVTMKLNQIYASS